MNLRNCVQLISLCVFLSSMDGLFALDPFMDHSAKLRNDIFGGGRYDMYNSPMAINGNISMTVQLRLLVIHVVRLEEAISSLTINGWLLISWNDFRLKWNPDDYGGTYVLRVPDRSIWVPDINLFNDVEAMNTDNMGDVDMLVYRGGIVYWVSPVTLKSTCVADLKFYPFDEHQCTSVMGSWGSGAHEMRLDTYYVDQTHEAEVLGHFFTENPQWEITNQDQYIRNISYTCCPDSHFHLFVMQLNLRRRSPFYKFLLVSPSVMTMLMTLALFWLPPDSPTKFTLGGIVIGVQVFLLLFLGWQLPAGGTSIPSIVLFCGNSLVMSTLSIIVSVIVLRISRRCNKVPVPEIFKGILYGCGGKILCMSALETNVWAHFISKVNFPKKDKDDPQLIDSSQVEVDIPDQDDKNAPPVENSPGSSEWVQVAVAVDRIVFVFYCFVFAIIVMASFTQ